MGGSDGVLRWGRLPYHALRRERRLGVVLLLYHRVGGGTWDDLDLSAELFERQMRWIRARYRVLSLDDVAGIAAGQCSPLADDVVAVTFDDGSVETYTVAFPILRRLGIPATVYLPAAYVERQQPFDFGVYQSVEHARRPWPLTWAQAAEMAGSGVMTIGAHTSTHADLSQVSEAAARRELDECDDLIASRLGRRPSHFAYPWGRRSPDAHRLVASRYATVVLARTGKNPYAALDPKALLRYPVIPRDGFWFFRARLRTLPPRPAPRPDTPW